MDFQYFLAESATQVQVLVMPLFSVRSIEWDIEDGVDVTIVKVTGTVDGVGSGDVIDYRHENMAMDPQLCEVSAVLSMLDDLSW